MNENVLCPVCQKYVLNEDYEQCTVCGWTHCFLQEEDADLKNMHNIMSLNEAREAYAKGEEIY